MSDTLPALYRDVDEILERLGALAISNDAQYEEAGDFLNRIAKTEKTVKDYYEEDRATTYAVYQGVLADIKKFTEPLGKASKTTKGMMNRYLASKQPPPEIRDTTPAPPLPTSSGTSTYDVWSFEVTDLSQVKPEYLTINEDAVKRIVAEMHELAEGVVGGIKVTKEVRVKAKGR